MEALDLLKKKQEALEMCDGDFAAFLGISAAHWSLLRRHRRAMGGKTRILAAERWPKHRDIFLSMDDDKTG